LARRLFGTDGVRGVAGELLTAELALGLGRAAATQSGARRVLVLRDTRESGPMLEAALAAGASAAGAEVLLAGVLPTPAAPLLIGRYGFDLAAVISASHNPYEDNGIKFFGGDGFKLSDATEAAIEAHLGDPAAGRPERFGAIRALRGAEEDYLRALHERFAALDLSGRRILLDCANGATYRVAPEVFRRLGAEVTVIADEPDGRNINAGVGSTHVDALAERMRTDPHDAAFAFDGDGDRVLAVDRAGAVVDGDELLALAATARDVAGVAVTVMTNFGFHTAMREAGVEVATTKVGDRYVLEELRARGWPLGGEQSGHLIDMAFVPSGDGVAAALLTLEALGGTDLADRAAMEKLPQKLVNVRVADKEAAMGSDALREALDREGAGLEGRGRVLVRPSGTEQLVRVMVEAPTDDEADAVCARLVTVVESA
jgi:phosphoglucosamine mutase